MLSIGVLLHPQPKLKEQSVYGLRKRNNSMKTKLLVLFFVVTLLTATMFAGDVTKADMSQGYSPFRSTRDEINKGIVFYGEGVYYFPNKNQKFGEMLAEFKCQHIQLQLESMAPSVVAWDNQIGGYYVTFRLKESK